MLTKTLTALAAVAGGALLITFAVLAAGVPDGCAGDECLLRSHRDLGDLNTLFTVGGLLILLAFAGLAGRLRAAGRPAVVAMGAGLVLFTAGIAWGEDAWMVLVVPGAAVCVVGSAMAGVAMIRTGVAARWVGALLVAGSLGLFAANDQDDRVLALIPFAVAWIVVGLIPSRPVVERV